MSIRLPVSALLMTGFLQVAAAATDGQVQRGKTFVGANCATCHAVGRIGESPLAVAPAFRELHTKYPVEDLGEALAEGITTGHPTMPQFELEPDQITDVLAYLKSLEQ